MLADPDEPGTAGAPSRALVHSRATPDTLRCSASLDLAGEPIVLSVPESRGRYYALWLRDADGQVFASIGPRTIGTGRRAFAVLGPHAHAVRLPPGLTPIRSLTREVQVAGRIEAAGESDVEAIARAREDFQLAPLSRWSGGWAPAPPPLAVTPLRELSEVGLGEPLAPGWVRTSDDPAADALHVLADMDAERQPLSGGQRYVLRFAPDAAPPVHGFWELTAGERSIGDRHPLALDADGALTIHIQHAPPSRARLWNWLPAPAGSFSVSLHRYWPREEPWSPPSITRAR